MDHVPNLAGLGVRGLTRLWLKNALTGLCLFEGSTADDYFPVSNYCADFPGNAFVWQYIGIGTTACRTGGSETS
jgi:hypothetical protein